MTRPEMTGQRSLAFSGWIRENLPDSSTGLCVSNLDWIFFNWRTRRLLLAEEKTYGGEMSTWFTRLVYEVLDPLLWRYASEVDVEYKGFHEIVFQNTSPDDGAVFLDGEEISASALAEFLSLN